MASYVTVPLEVSLAPCRSGLCSHLASFQVKIAIVRQNCTKLGKSQGSQPKFSHSVVACTRGRHSLIEPFRIWIYVQILPLWHVLQHPQTQSREPRKPVKALEQLHHLLYGGARRIHPGPCRCCLRQPVLRHDAALTGQSWRHGSKRLQDNLGSSFTNFCFNRLTGSHLAAVVLVLVLVCLGELVKSAWDGRTPLKSALHSNISSLKQGTPSAISHACMPNPIPV